jgi:hypothetical protein
VPETVSPGSANSRHPEFGNEVGQCQYEWVEQGCEDEDFVAYMIGIAGHQEPIFLAAGHPLCR